MQTEGNIDSVEPRGNVSFCRLLIDYGTVAQMIELVNFPAKNEWLPLHSNSLSWPAPLGLI